jgi:hypothetical protein
MRCCAYGSPGDSLCLIAMLYLCISGRCLGVAPWGVRSWPTPRPWIDPCWPSRCPGCTMPPRAFICPWMRPMRLVLMGSPPPPSFPFCYHEYPGPRPCQARDPACIATPCRLNTWPRRRPPPSPPVPPVAHDDAPATRGRRGAGGFSSEPTERGQVARENHCHRPPGAPDTWLPPARGRSVCSFQNQLDRDLRRKT